MTVTAGGSPKTFGEVFEKLDEFWISVIYLCSVIMLLNIIVIRHEDTANKIIWDPTDCIFRMILHTFIYHLLTYFTI